MMSASIEFTIFLAVGVAGVIFTTILLKRLFGDNGGSVQRDFEARLKTAMEMEQEIAKLKKESVRDTADFKSRLAAHRAKFGSGNDVPPDNGPRAG